MNRAAMAQEEPRRSRSFHTANSVIQCVADEQNMVRVDTNPVWTIKLCLRGLATVALAPTFPTAGHGGDLPRRRIDFSDHVVLCVHHIDALIRPDGNSFGTVEECLVRSPV